MARTPRQDSSFRNLPTKGFGLHPSGVAAYLSLGQALPPDGEGGGTQPTLLVPRHAWLLLCRKTGTSLSRTTFYRWLREGRILTVRVGHRLFVPVEALEEVVARCLAGERC